MPYSVIDEFEIKNGRFKKKKIKRNAQLKKKTKRVQYTDLQYGYLSN